MEESDKKFVIDASFVLAYLLGEDNEKVADVFKRYFYDEIELVAPNLLHCEVGNGLRTAVLRKKISPKTARVLYQTFLDFEIKTNAIDFNQVLELAVRKKISFYDASYVALAKSLSLPLLSLDKNLIKF
jgi:predicted nucleic acid-binding protein